MLFRITELLEQINYEELGFMGLKFETRTEYAVDYIDIILQQYKAVYNLDPKEFVFGRGHRKSMQQKRYQTLEAYRDRLKKYADHIKICGDSRNSYSKTDHDATFMRIKTDYMGND